MSKTLLFLIGDTIMLTPEMEKKLRDKIKAHPLSNEEKIEMFDTIQYQCALYGVNLFSKEDAENFWKVLRYGNNG